MWLISAGRYRLARVTFCADLSLLSLVAVAAAVVGAGPIDGLLAPSCFWASALPATDVTIRAARPTFAMFFIRVPLVGKAVHRSHYARSGTCNSFELDRSYWCQMEGTVRHPPFQRA